MKKLKKVLRFLFIVAVVTISATLLFGTIYYHKTTRGVSLNDEKLGTLKFSSNLEILDDDGKKINFSHETFIPVGKLSNDTKNAFISTEDKRFYKHSGIDYIRIAGAIFSNLKSKSFSEGGSTISQQLIKNTQLSSEKTIKRKLKEFKLARELEKKYSKNEILEMYLNNIYFGNGCYGIENAAEHYFSKSASKLTLSESALLAGTINAPGIYDIEDKQQNAISRRNLVLSLMQKHGKISKEKMKEAQNEPLNLNLKNISSNTHLLSEILKEASKQLGKTENQLRNSNLKIHTYINQNLSDNISSFVKNNYSNLESNPKCASFVIDNKTHGVISVFGNKNTLSSLKQPGSSIKPLLVYAPAIEHGLISPASKINDEKINIGGYSPNNADKKFHRLVSVREALKNSYNIPAVKILNELGFNKAISFAKNIGLNMNKKDKNLASALGALSSGTTIKSIVDAYSAFACDGNFVSSSYIKKITSNGKIIFENNISPKKVMSDSTAYLITNILLDTTKTGTAKRLKDFNFQIASKTGTVGKTNSTKNTDAFCVSYTTDHTIISYFGETSMPEHINGATYPTMLSKQIIEWLYKNNTPKDFKIPSSIEKINLSKSAYENDELKVPENENDSFTEFFSKNNLPKIENFSSIPKIDVLNFENQKPLICLNAPPNSLVKIYRKQKNEEELLFSTFVQNSQNLLKFEDKTAVFNEIYDYFAEITDFKTNKVIKTNSVKLKSF